ncbi:hypothetical protein Aca07nite_62870 [Actinoplanes capillaceus]|uniref:FXSXX-COOH protein n=1 Tax=Actinoplanes campanulatus TaxID=113559 RepID=A0ABQ3WRT8_9ACTN|nr:hypothetical protein Aca07nite_62870 [Actinoplanes capillaceus]
MSPCQMQDSEGSQVPLKLTFADAGVDVANRAALDAKPVTAAARTQRAVELIRDKLSPFPVRSGVAPSFP